MPTASVDGLDLYYEEHGAGFPLLLSHEFADDYRGWEPQVRYFARHYRVITYNNRGYPPSTVPDDPTAYSQERLVEDLKALLDHLGIERAHICGLSMGGYVALVFALTYPERCASAVVAGCGTGSNDPEAFRANARELIARIEEQGMAGFAASYGRGPARLPFLRKDPLGWRAFHDRLAAHSARGSALIFGNVQLKRPTVYDWQERLDAARVPLLVMTGDEDEPCLLPSLFIKHHARGAGLAVLPDTGHALNLEEPARFNALVHDFLSRVEHGTWPVRDAPGAVETLF